MSTQYLISPDSPLRILFVEDNELNRFYFLKTTEKLNDEIEMAENGQIALAKASSKIYDFIFMDINMPVMNGYEAIKAIKNLAKPYCHAKIIGITSTDLDTDLNLEKNAGIIDFIDKTFNIEELQNKIPLWMQSEAKETTEATPDFKSSADSPILKIKDATIRNKMIQIFINQQEELIVICISD